MYRFVLKRVRARTAAVCVVVTRRYDGSAPPAFADPPSLCSAHGRGLSSCHAQAVLSTVRGSCRECPALWGSEGPSLLQRGHRDRCWRWFAAPSFFFFFFFTLVTGPRRSLSLISWATSHGVSLGIPAAARTSPTCSKLRVVEGSWSTVWSPRLTVWSPRLRPHGGDRVSARVPKSYN